MASSKGYLLDTNILVQLIRGNLVGQAIATTFGLQSSLNHCVISIVTVGELHSLACQWNWPTQKIDMLQRQLRKIVTLDINERLILDAYGELDNWSLGVGRRMEKNDVWIAATAKATKVTLLTMDHDFCHLNPSHLSLILIDAKTGNPLT